MLKGGSTGSRPENSSGDGGSRTRVQKHLLTCYYTLIPCICSCLATPKGKRRCFGQQRQISGFLLVAKIQPYPGLRLGCHPSGSGGGSKGYPKIRQPLLQVQHLFFFNLFSECPRLRPRRATHASASLSIPSIPKDIYNIQKSQPSTRLRWVDFLIAFALTGFWRWGTCPAFSLTSFVIIVPVPSRRAARQRLSFLFHLLRHQEQRVPPDVFIYAVPLPLLEFLVEEPKMDMRRNRGVHQFAVGGFWISRKGRFSCLFCMSFLQSNRLRNDWKVL